MSDVSIVALAALAAFSVGAWQYTRFKIAELGRQLVGVDVARAEELRDAISQLREQVNKSHHALVSRMDEVDDTQRAVHDGMRTNTQAVENGVEQMRLQLARVDEEITRVSQVASSIRPGTMRSASGAF